MLGRIILVSLPNLLTIFLGIGLFCSLFPLREHAGIRLAIAAAVCFALSAASSIIHGVLTPALAAGGAGPAVQALPTLLFFALVLLASIPLARFVFSMGRWDAVFCCTAGYALQNFAHVVYELVSLRLALDPLSSAVLLLAISLAVYGLCAATVIRQIQKGHLAGEGDRHTLPLLLAVIALNIVLDSFGNTLSSAGLLPPAGFAVLRLTQAFACTLTLALAYELLVAKHLRTEAAVTHQLMESERRQFEASRDTVEAINRKCHDIRHQMYRISEGTESRDELLRDMSRLISIYDAKATTLNDAIDVAVNEKSLMCQARDIGLTCEVDGRLLSFMEDQDLYALFDSALDTAIAAADSIKEPDLRLIDISTADTGTMASIQMRTFADAFPEDASSFFLLKQIVRRYAGTVTMDTGDGMARFSILLPVPQK
ncbi:MAG: hypothetical protein ACI361_08010 [Atopobiaceae bacterium]